MVQLMLCCGTVNNLTSCPVYATGCLIIIALWIFAKHVVTCINTWKIYLSMIYVHSTSLTGSHTIDMMQVIIKIACIHVCNCTQITRAESITCWPCYQHLVPSHLVTTTLVPWCQPHTVITLTLCPAATTTRWNYNQTKLKWLYLEIWIFNFALETLHWSKPASLSLFYDNNNWAKTKTISVKQNYIYQCIKH